MNVIIPKDKVNLDDAYIGIDFPIIETEIRRIATEFIEGVLEENLRVNIQDDEQTNEKYVVVWASLYDGFDTPIATVPITDLFKEYEASKAN